MNIDFVTIDNEIQNGKPVFKGTRVPVVSLFDYLGNGANINDFSLDFPSVEKNHIISALKFSEKIFENKTNLDSEISPR